MSDRLTRVVGDDGDGIDRQLADAPAIEQVGKAMVKLADHDQHAPPPVAPDQLPVHCQLGGERLEGSAQGIGAGCQRIERDPHEEAVGGAVVELLRFEDIAALLEQEPGGPRGNPRPVSAGTPSGCPRP